jgi:hypothetical protein
MADKPVSPFAGLDKALLRSTAATTPVAPSRDPTPPPTHEAPIDKPIPRTRTASQPARAPASPHASAAASTLASYRHGLIESIRKTVKVPGREVSFIRLSPGEKTQLTDIVYAFKRRGRRTTETEINRIAVNFIIDDYQANGERSLLAKVLEALQA